MYQRHPPWSISSADICMPMDKFKEKYLRHSFPNYYTAGNNPLFVPVNNQKKVKLTYLCLISCVQSFYTVTSIYGRVCYNEWMVLQIMVLRAIFNNKSKLLQRIKMLLWTWSNILWLIFIALVILTLLRKYLLNQLSHWNKLLAKF